MKNQPHHQTHSDKSLKSLEHLMDCYAESLCKFSMTYVKTPEVAEEIVSDVFLKMWEKKNELHQIANIKAYLFASTKNLSLNYLKSNARKIGFSVEHSMQHPNIVEKSNPEQIFLQQELHNKIQQAIDELPEGCRTVYCLVKDDGFKYKEVAELLNISVNTVENQMGKALKKVRKTVEAYLVEEQGFNPQGKAIKLLSFLYIFLFLNFF